MKYLKETQMLDFSHPALQKEIVKWRNLDEFNKIKSAYDFVQNEIEFGYNVSDHIRASQVLADGYGQCNTKGILLMALLRGLDIPVASMDLQLIRPYRKGR